MLLRVLPMHPGRGHSLRETALRARRAGLADPSPVALMKRLAKSGPEIRAVDATTVKEPGKTGSPWRIHHGLRLPSLVCDHLLVTGTEGAGTGESFRRFPVTAGDCLIGDRGCSKAPGIARVAASGGNVVVGVDTGSPAFLRPDGQRFDLPAAVSTPGRLCVVGKSAAATGMALKALRRKASKSGKAPKPQSPAVAGYVIVFTTFPAAEFTPEEVLDCYRPGWQVEPVFRRFRSVAGPGHLPKHGSGSSKARLQGKLFTALLTEKPIAHAGAVSPRGTTSSHIRVTPGRWREFGFLPNRVRRTIEPEIPLQDALTEWPEISRELPEPVRKRRPQTERHHQKPGPLRGQCNKSTLMVRVQGTAIGPISGRGHSMSRVRRQCGHDSPHYVDHSAVAVFTLSDTACRRKPGTVCIGQIATQCRTSVAKHDRHNTSIVGFFNRERSQSGYNAGLYISEDPLSLEGFTINDRSEVVTAHTLFVPKLHARPVIAYYTVH